MSRFNNKFPFIQIYTNSMKLYRTKVDNKYRRMKLDILSAKITYKNNFVYDRKTKTWIKSGKSSTLTILVKSDPKSYETIDTINTHKYPVTFEFQNINLGVLTPFKWREGGLKKPVFNIQGCPDKKTERIKVANTNILNGTQLQFFFDMEFVAKMYNLLWGKNYAGWFPKKTNPQGLIYFGKHALYCINKIVLPLFKSGKLNQGVIKKSP